MIRIKAPKFNAPQLKVPEFKALIAYPRLAALLSGAIGACAYPPLALWPLGLIALGVLIWLLCRAPSAKGAGMLAYIFAWSHLTLANNWIATAFNYQAEMPAFIGWLAVPLLCLYLAIYPAIAAYMAHLLAHRVIARPSRIPIKPAAEGQIRPDGIFAYGALFAACWIVAEWLRSWVFTGYPWPPLGLMLLGGFDRPGIAMILPWIGTYALSGVAILIAAAMLAFAQLRRWASLMAMAVMLAVLMYWPAPRTEEGAIDFALIQPYIPQEEINNPAKYEEHFARIAKLTMPGSEGRRLVLWPESAVPDYLQDGYPAHYYARNTAAGDPEFARRRIGSVIGDQSLLLTGLTDLEIGRRDGREAAVGAYNSVSVIDGTGRLGDRYVKAHLVPYGEYLALRWLLEPLGASRLVAGTIDFIPGPGPQTLDLGEFGRAGIQICYEIIFSGQIVDRDNRPEYIFNPSNDGWFGSWGPPQHLAQARMRALEEGLPVLRSTTTGISAVIDANGVVRAHIDAGKAGRLDGLIPPAGKPTLFASLGNILALIWAALLALLSLVAMRRRNG